MWAAPAVWLCCVQERGLAISKKFKGVVSMGGRMHSKDCAVSSMDINGKVPLPLGILCIDL